MNDKSDPKDHKMKIILIAGLVLVICAALFAALQSPDIRRTVGLEQERPRAKMLIDSFNIR